MYYSAQRAENQKKVYFTFDDAPSKYTMELLSALGDAGKEPPAMAKGMAAMKSGMKMMMGNPDQQAADLITDGCGMGVKSLSRYLNQYPNAQPQAQKVTRELIGEEESLAKDVRPYL